MWVEIEDDLAAAIQLQRTLGEPGERIVQRLLLEAIRGRAAARLPAARTRVAVSGSLKQLLDSGLIDEGDEIRFTEVRRGTVHIGRIDAEGRIHTNKGVQTSPSTALRQLVNYSMNGWKYWVHVPTGKTLAELRREWVLRSGNVMTATTHPRSPLLPDPAGAFRGSSDLSGQRASRG